MARRGVWIGAGLAVLALSAGLWTAGQYRADMRAIRAELAAQSRVVQTRSGPVAVAEGGAGRPVLVIHGAGGGFDQGALIARALGGDGIRWIAPSRFGYPGAAMPADASPAAQARALADLTDALDLGPVAVMGMSGGAVPALHFAALFPERTTALVLLSTAPFAPYGAADQAPPIPVWAYDALFATDFPFWALWRAAPGGLARMFDAGPAHAAKAGPEERAFVAAMVRAFLPVTARTAGLGNEGAAIAAGSDPALEAITAPTLIIHARDDALAPRSGAARAAARIAGATVIELPDGGHLLLGHHAALRARIAEFLAAAPGAVTPAGWPASRPSP